MFPGQPQYPVQYPNATLPGLPVSAPPWFGGMAQAAGNMMLNSFAQQQFAQYNMLPMGPMNANPYDTMTSTARYHQQNKLVQAMAERDIDKMMATARGLAIASGATFDQPQQDLIRRTISQLGTAAAPALIASGMGGFLDSLAGPGGTALTMSVPMYQANQLRLDPLTGLRGNLSAERTAQMAEGIYSEFFGAATDSDEVKRMKRAKMGGLQSVDVGSMYQYMVSNGMISSSSLDRPDIIRGALARAKEGGGQDLIDEALKQAGATGTAIEDLTDEQLRDVANTTSGQGMLGAADTSRIKSTIEKYVGAVGVMKELFGANGINAPIPMLMEALKSMTGGTMAGFSQTQMTEMAGTLRSYTAMSGMSLEQAGAYMTRGQQMAQAYGLDRGTGVKIGFAAMEGGFMYDAMGLGSSADINTDTREEYIMKQQQLTASAANSETARNMAVVAKYDKMLNFEEGTTAAAMAKAIREGKQTFVDPKSGKTIDLAQMSTADVQSIIAEGSGGAVTTADVQDSMNNRAFYNNDLEAGTDIAVRGQADEAFARATDTARETAKYKAERAKKTPEQAAAEGALAAATIESVRSMTDAEYDEFAVKGVADVKGMRDRIRNMDIPQAQKDYLLSLSDKELTVKMTAAITDVPDMEDTRDLYSEEAMKGRVQAQDQARADEIVRNATTAQFADKKGNVLQKLFGAIQGLKPGERSEDAIKKIVAETLGGVGTAEAKEALTNALLPISEELAAVEAEKAEAVKEKDPEKRRRKIEALEERAKTLRGKVQELTEVADAHNLSDETLEEPEAKGDNKEPGTNTADAGDKKPIAIVVKALELKGNLTLTDNRAEVVADSTDASATTGAMA